MKIFHIRARLNHAVSQPADCQASFAGREEKKRRKINDNAFSLKHQHLHHVGEAVEMSKLR